MTGARRIAIPITAAALLAMRFLAPAAPANEAPVPDLTARLLALDPSAPEAYFRLAEEVAYEMPGGGGQTLARTLFVLAMELDLRDGDRSLAHGAALALADMAPDPAERRWLTAVARALAVDHDAPGWILDESSTEDDLAPIRLADAIAEFRAGRRQRIKRFDSVERIERLLVRAGLGPAAARAAARTLDWDLRSLPASMAGGERTVADPIERGKVMAHPDNGGNPGPALDAERMLAQLRAEAALLGASPTSWAAQGLVDGGAPLRSIEPDEVAERYRVDPEAVYWRPDPGDDHPLAGAWARRPPADEAGEDPPR